MHHPPPPEDSLVIYCKGRCGASQTLTIPYVKMLIRHGSRFDEILEFTCTRCNHYLVGVIERPITLDDAPMPT